MGGELNLNTILDASQIDDLFGSNETVGKEDKPTEENNPQEENQQTTEVDIDDLFEQPESVGSEEESEDTVINNSDGYSHNSDFYSSIASALVSDGVLSDLDVDVKTIKSAEDFSDYVSKVVEKQVNDRYTEQEKRIQEALNANMEPSKIQQYEQINAYLGGITEDKLREEGEDGDNLRKEMIYYDLINRGYSQDRAQKRVEQLIANGNDVDEAIEALENNINYYNREYSKALEEAKQSKVQEEEKLQERMESFKKSIMEDKNVFGGIELSKEQRQKVYDNTMKPSYTDPKTGNKLTPIQKYQQEHPDEFLKAIGVLYTTTNGFKDISSLVKTKVNREVNKSIRELEHTLNNTSRNTDGGLQFMTGVADKESLIRGFDLDL